MNKTLKHKKFVEKNIKNISKNKNFLRNSSNWLKQANKLNYTYNFNWLSRPIIQLPTDLYALQEIIWKVKPDLIIETGVAHGGSIIHSASFLAILNYIDILNNKKKVKRKVIGIDIDIRKHNKLEIQKHPLYNLIELKIGSSVDKKMIKNVYKIAKNFKKIIVILDSNHSHDHVYKELLAYSKLVNRGSYCIVWDAGIEDYSKNFKFNRPWGKGDNPRTAVHQFLKDTKKEKLNDINGKKLNFEIDKKIDNKIVITSSGDGFLLRK
jgi:cephalosporin hydroxylase